MGELPAWWKWEPAGVYDAPIGARLAVYDESRSWVACIFPSGRWWLSIGETIVQSESANDALEARRQCERVYVAVMGVLGEVSHG